MSLIRSEHINDKAVREAKEAVDAAENALEEARSYLEKRERAQYHEEQIWSDTIRRNSTWVTFGLMGVNIFLLLLSLLILEPWRRRRMVREIKTTLEAQKAAVEATPALAITPTFAAANSATETPASQQVALVQKATEPEATIEKVVGATSVPAEAASPTVAEPNVGKSPTTRTEEPIQITDEDGAQIGNVIEEVEEPIVNPVAPGSAPLMPKNIKASMQDTIYSEQESRGPVSPSDKIWAKLESWQSTAAFIAEDIVSDRPISMRRVDYTTAILQGAAAGAVIAAATIAMLLRSN